MLKACLALIKSLTGAALRKRIPLSNSFHETMNEILGQTL